MPDINLVKQTPPPTPQPADAPPTPPPPVPAEPPKPLTDAELQERRKSLVQSMGWDKTEVGKEVMDEKPKEEPAAAAPPSEPSPAPTTEPQPPKKAGRTRRESTESMITRVATETATRVMEAGKPKELTPAENDTGLTPEDQKDYQAFQTLEQIEPTQKGIAEKFLTFAKARYDYEAKWLTENPGQEFNPDAPEHEEFYAKNQPQVDESKIEEARDEMKFQERYNRTVKPQLDEIKQEKAWQKAAPIIGERVDTHVARLVSQFDQKLGELVHLDGKPNLTKESVDKIAETDPLARKLLDGASSQFLEPMILELEKTTIPELNYALDGRNPAQKLILQNLIDAEKEFLAMPEEDQIDPQGRKFLTHEQMARKKEQVHKSKASADEKTKQLGQISSDFWAINVDQLEDLITNKIALETRKAYDEIRKLTGVRETPAAPAAPSPAPTIPAPAARRAPAPSIASSSEVITTSAAGAAGEKKFAEIAAGLAFPRA